MRNFNVALGRWRSFHQSTELLQKIFKRQTLSSSHRRSSRVATSIATLITSMLVTILTFQGEANRMKSDLLSTTPIPYEILEQWLTQKGYRKSQLTAPLPGISELKISDCWVHHSRMWIILGGELYSAPSADDKSLGSAPNSTTVSQEWTKANPSIGIWLNWIKNWKITAPISPDRQVSQKKKPYLDRRQLRF